MLLEEETLFLPVAAGALLFFLLRKPELVCGDPRVGLRRRQTAVVKRSGSGLEVVIRFM